MKVHRKKRLLVILGFLFTLGTAGGLVLYALSQNINLFLTPTELLEQTIPAGKQIRLGGLVQKGSIFHQKNSLKVEFTLTDLKNSMKVNYDGILPDLFRDGQGAVVQGSFQENGQFQANEVLAKHDENYMPPNINQKGLK